MKRILRFAGRAVKLHATGPSSRALVDFLFDQMPSHGSAHSHITLGLKDIPGSQQVCLSLPDTGAEIFGTVNQVAAQLLAAVDFHLADRCHAGLYLHAASLVRNRQTLILPATSGSGKSTLTYWLTRHGFQYLSDEASFIPTGGLTCSGFTRPVHIKSGALALFPELETAPRLDIRWSDESLFGWLVGASALNVFPQGDAPALGKIVFPLYQPGGAPVIEQLSAARAAFELAGCLINARNLYDRGFPEILRLARSIPAWRVSYNDFSQVEEFFSLP